MCPEVAPARTRDPDLTDTSHAGVGSLEIEDNEIHIESPRLHSSQSTCGGWHAKSMKGLRPSRDNLCLHVPRAQAAQGRPPVSCSRVSPLLDAAPHKGDWLL